MAKLRGDSDKRSVWLLDSGCSNHLTTNEMLFSDLDRSFTAQIKIKKWSTFEDSWKRNCFYQHFVKY